MRITVALLIFSLAVAAAGLFVNELFDYYNAQRIETLEELEQRY